MAVTATFKADFSSFTAAVEKAEVELRSFETGASKVEKALGRMTDSFSGRRVIQEATLTAKAIEDIGGVSKLTESELRRVSSQAQEAVEKLKAMGMDVPDGIQKVADATKNTGSAFEGLKSPLSSVNSLLGIFGVGLSVSAVVGFGKGVMSMASGLNDLSTSTGVAADALQKFGYIGTGAGISVDVMGNAIGTLSERLASGDKSAVGAVHKLNLSIEALVAAGPEEAFIQIGEAVGRMEDPMQRNAVAADLFGSKLAKQLIPSLADLRKAMNDVPEDAIVSNEDIKSIADLGTAIDQLTLKTKGYAAAKILSMFKPSREDWEKMAGTDFANQMANAGNTDIQLPVIADQTGFVEGLRDGADEIDALHEAFKKYTQDIAQFNKSVEEAKSAGDGWRGTILTIDGALVDHSKALLQAGMSAGSLATYYELTGTQVTALQKSIQADTEALRKEAEALVSTTALWSEYTATVSAQGTTGTNKQIAEVMRWADATAAAAQKAGTDTAAFYDALAATTTAKLRGISVDWTSINNELSTGTKAGLQEIADKAQATYQAALAHVGEFSDGAIQRFRDTADAAQLAANAFGTGFESASVRATAALQETVAQAAKAKAALDMMFAGDAVPTSESLSDAAMRPGSFLGFGGGSMRQGTTGFVSNMPWPARANGGPVSSGQPYMVGERGPELFTPSQSGFITPNGGGNSITVNISAGVFDRSTVAGLADQIGQELMRRVNRRLPSA